MRKSSDDSENLSLIYEMFVLNENVNMPIDTYWKDKFGTYYKLVSREGTPQLWNIYARSYYPVGNDWDAIVSDMNLQEVDRDEAFADVNAKLDQDKEHMELGKKIRNLPRSTTDQDMATRSRDSHAIMKHIKQKALEGPPHGIPY